MLGWPNRVLTWWSVCLGLRAMLGLGRHCWASQQWHPTKGGTIEQEEAEGAEGDLTISLRFSAASHEGFSVKACQSCCLWYLTNLPFALVPSTAH